jgi:hypothetical protein
VVGQLAEVFENLHSLVVSLDLFLRNQGAHLGPQPSFLLRQCFELAQTFGFLGALGSFDTLAGDSFGGLKQVRHPTARRGFLGQRGRPLLTRQFLQPAPQFGGHTGFAAQQTPQKLQALVAGESKQRPRIR